MLLSHLLERMVQNGTLRVIDASGKTHEFGGVAPGPTVAIRLHDRALYAKLFVRPQLHLGEAYTDGTLTLEDGTLEDFLALIAVNLWSTQHHPARSAVVKLANCLRNLHQYNPIGKARTNVAHHYDLSSTLYDLFLDHDHQYSCAYFANDNDTLEVAQDNKKRLIAAKLRLDDGGLKVLDIGSGWGGLGLYLARVSDAHVTGVTLSEEQYLASNRRAEAAGLADRVRFALRDYRREQDVYDRIVSVGMFEHVGVRHYEEFFAKLRDLLAENGVALLHSIGRSTPPGTTNPWIRKYIFPGGYIPALSEVMAAVEKVGLWATDIEILRLHYADTLREWHWRFQANRDRIKALYDERFCRMWEFYLLSSEMNFRHQDLMVFQLQLCKRQDAVPLTRDYIGAWEQSHAQSANVAV